MFLQSQITKLKFLSWSFKSVDEEFQGLRLFLSQRIIGMHNLWLPNCASTCQGPQ
jgi:hypothetical protein